MMGYDTQDGSETGVTPRLCEGLLAAAKETIQVARKNSITGLDIVSPTVPLSPTAKVNRVLSVELSVSYYEIYNEKVHDLLSASPELSCRVRESKDEGAFVENLSRRDFRSEERRVGKEC